MELQGLLVLCGLGVAGAAVLLLMGLFSTSGTSYEEAMAQQRRATTELLALAETKNKPKKSVKKANKKLAKKEKQKEPAAANSSEPESEAPAESGADDDPAPAPKPHVEFTTPTVVDVPRDTSPNVKIRKRGKDPKVKPILINKEDPSCVSDPSAPPTPVAGLPNHFEELQPKDELELMHSAHAADKVAVEKKEEAKEAKEVKAKPAKTKAVAKVEPAKEEVPRERRNSGDVPKDQRKANKKADKKPIEEVSEVPHEEVVPPLNAPQPSELTTEKLLRQANAAPVPATASAPAAAPAPARAKAKNKKQETNMLSLIAGNAGGLTVSELVRLVSEAPLSRTEIQVLTDALLNKQHDPLPQHSEWSEGPNDPMQKLKKQLADKEKALAAEAEASQGLQARLKELRSSLNAERSRAAAAARAAEEAAADRLALQARLQRLADDNHALAQDKMLLQSKLGAESEAERAQRVQMEMHIQRLSEAETALLGQLSALQAEAQARALEAGGARCEAAAARDAALLAQQHAADLAQQLQEANRVCAELDAARQGALMAEQGTQQELRAAQDKLNAVSELQAEVQRVTSQAQIAESNAEKIKEDMEKQKQQLLSELSTLKEQLAAREVELAEVKQMKATAVPAQNGLPPTNMTDQHKAGELAKVEAVIESLRGELAAAQATSAEQRELALRLREQLTAYQDKNNELRTKNWKVMEALQTTERALQARIGSASPAQDLRDAIAKAEEAQYSEMAAVLRSACPSAAPPSPPSRAWLEAFAAALEAELEAARRPVATPSEPDNSRLEELRAQNEHLQGLVDKYKRIIDDTEGVLGRLQQDVSAEERRWASQLADKQRELDDLRARTLTQEPLAFAYSCIEKTLPAIITEMQNKIDSLQAELRQAQSANHNHSFADAERITEERLMGGLSEKHKLDSLNGPIQVGVDEK